MIILLWPLILIPTPEMRTLPQSIALFKGGYNTPYPEQPAVSTWPKDGVTSHFILERSHLDAKLPEFHFRVHLLVRVLLQLNLINPPGACQSKGAVFPLLARRK